MKVGTALLAMFMAFQWSACGTIRTVGPAAPLLQPRPPQLRDPLFDQVLRRFASSYLEPQRIDPEAMLDGAMASLAKDRPEVTSRTRQDRVELRIDDGRTAPLARPKNLDQLSAMLDAASAWLAQELQPTIDPLELTTASLRGAVKAVDRWATVVHGSSRNALLDRFRGSLSGIGCRIGRRDGVIRILEAYPGAAAARAGLASGDEIVRVDGRDVSGHSVAEIVQLLRGPVETVVRVETRRSLDGPPVEHMVRRSRFVVPTVFSRMLGGDVGYLRVTRIAKNSGVVAHRLLGGLRESPSLKGVVLDLRGNSGGSMLAAGQIADEFVPSGVLIETQGRDGRHVPGLRHRIDATVEGSNRLPVIVLVDGRTGSSAEFLAAALMRHNRAILLGKRTFGKSVLQKTYTFPNPDDVLLKVTVARVLAGGAPVSAEGLQPDISVAESDGEEPGLECSPQPTSKSVATLSIGPDEVGSPDPIASNAAELIRRYAVPDRNTALESIRRDLCPEMVRPAPSRSLG